jgi:hypothetical protein
MMGDRPGGRECTTSSKRTNRNGFGASTDGRDQNVPFDASFDDPPYQAPRSVVVPRLTVSAAVLGAIVATVVTFGFLRQSAPGGIPPTAYVPVFVGSTPQDTASPWASATAAPVPSASSAGASASPRVSASPHATRSSPSPSPSSPFQVPSASSSPSPSPAASRLPPRAYSADASSNILAGGAYVDNCYKCPDGRRVRNLGNGSNGSNGSNGTLTFPDVSATVAGDYDLTIVFTEGDTSGGRMAIVTVDGTNYYEYFPGDGDWNDPRTFTMMVHLVPGNNSIEFSNPRAYAPDMVGIVV